MRFDGPERRWVPEETVSREAESDFAGERLSVLNDHGDVEVVGVPGLSRVRLHGRPSVVADDSADAEHAFPYIASNIRIELNQGVLVIGCNQASADPTAAAQIDLGRSLFEERANERVFLPHYGISM